MIFHVKKLSIFIIFLLLVYEIGDCEAKENKNGEGKDNSDSPAEPEEKSEKDTEEKSEKDTEEKSEKDTEEKSVKDTEEKSEKEMETEARLESGKSLKEETELKEEAEEKNENEKSETVTESENNKKTEKNEEEETKETENEEEKDETEKSEESGTTVEKVETNPPVVETTEEIQEKEETLPPKMHEETTEFSTESVTEEPMPEGTFTVRNSEGKICILAKFHVDIQIIYPGEDKDKTVDVIVPNDGNVKGQCESSLMSPVLQISWGKFVIIFMFNKSSEDTWYAASIELTYDTRHPLFDRAVNRGKQTARSGNLKLFETPVGKSYFCPGEESIPLYTRKDKQSVTVKAKKIHLQPYEVQHGKFSPQHRCNQVVIGGLDEEPFVQDETIPLAVGCTLALITLLILVGFSVHRAYHAAKVDYNSME